MGKRHSVFVLFVAVLAAVVSKAQEPSANLEEQLLAEYRVTRLTGDNWGIEETGTVLILRQGGFSAGPMSNKVTARNTYKDGQIKAEIPGLLRNCFFCNAIPGGDALNGAMSAAGTSRKLSTGERLYVTNINVERGKDAIIFDLVSDPYRSEGRYRGLLAFKYPKGSIRSADLAQVQPMIAEVFRAIPPQEYVTSVGPDRRTQAPATATATATMAATATARRDARPTLMEPEKQDAPLPPLEIPVAPVPDQPAPEREPKVIRTGQTREQVTALIGQPLSINSVGDREVYQYKDVRVIFVNGRMVEVD